MGDEAARINQKHWENMVSDGCGFTVPCLDLNRDLIDCYLAGKLDPVPEPLCGMYPASILADVEGKDLLCLASGGGQQSVVFGLLGARVTVVDIAKGQLEGDIKAAAHYGYEVTTIHADMRDLSCLSDESFDLVYQEQSMAYVPDVHEVYSEVARVLRPGGVYRACFSNPAVEFVDCEDWDGEGYRITRPYSENVRQRENGPIEFRHYLSDVFNRLIESGMSVQQVTENPNRRQWNSKSAPGSWEHWLAYVFASAFAVVARKNG